MQTSRSVFRQGLPHVERETRIHITAFRSSANDTLHLIHAMVVEYSACSLSERSAESLWRKRLRSGPTAPLVVKTKGQKEPCSTFTIRSSYSSCFCLSRRRNTHQGLCRDTKRRLDGTPTHRRTCPPVVTKSLWPLRQVGLLETCLLIDVQTPLHSMVTTVAR